MSDENTARRVSPMETWLLEQMAQVPVKDGEQHPGIACQIVFAIGQAASGAVRATGIPGVFQMLVEGKDQHGQTRVLDRYFQAETIFLIDVPRALPVVQPVGGRIILPQG